MRYIHHGLAAAIAAVLSAAPASAHVLLENKEAAIGSRIRAVFIVGHGCANTDTLKLRVKIPEGVIAVEPEAKEGWTIATTKGKYATEYDYEGGKVSEGSTAWRRWATACSSSARVRAIA